MITLKKLRGNKSSGQTGSAKCFGEDLNCVKNVDGFMNTLRFNFRKK